LRPVILGVAGGSGSGMTTVVRAITQALGGDHVSVIHHDSYYRDTSHLAH
jgi:uridine kinase